MPDYPGSGGEFWEALDGEKALGLNLELNYSLDGWRTRTNLNCVKGEANDRNLVVSW
jgi:hypothetical protein